MTKRCPECGTEIAFRKSAIDGDYIDIPCDCVHNSHRPDMSLESIQRIIAARRRRNSRIGK